MSVTTVSVKISDCPGCKKPIMGDALVVIDGTLVPDSEGKVSGVVTGKIESVRVSHDCRTQMKRGTLQDNAGLY